MGVAQTLKDFVVGALIGIFMMLPGASGATMAVVFKVYERIIRDISQIWTYLIKDAKFLVVIAIGVAVGFFICAKVLNFVIKDYEIPLMFMFAALILMQIPDIWKQSKDSEPVTKYNILAFIVGFAIMMIVLYLGMRGNGSVAENPGPIVMFFVGVIYIMSALSPGISGSTILLALGLYTFVVNAISNLDIITLLPVALGLVIGAILFANFIERSLERSRKSTYFAILGLTVGSIVTVIVQALSKINGEQTMLCIAFAVIGIVFGYIICKFSSYYSA